jgi:hypothetical protein
MSNPFERHGIAHLSPSHLNLYASSPAKWALCYLHKFKEVGPSMWRGQAVEAGIISYLRDRDLDAAIKVALWRFEEEALGEVSDEIEKELALIPGMVEQGSIALASWEKPTRVQIRVEHKFDGIDIPIIGFADAEWPAKGLEIKSTSRMPSEISAAHSSQTGFYELCLKKPFDVLYVSKSKWQIIPLEDAAKHVRRLEWTAHAIQDLLTAFPDPLVATRILPAPDYDHPFLWKSPAAREAAAQIWS